MKKEDKNTPQTEAEIKEKGLSRRAFLAGAGGALCTVAIGANSALAKTKKGSEIKAQKQQASLSDILAGDYIGVLGLGAGPVMWSDRNNTAFLLVVNEAQYMVDCGIGTPNEIHKLGLGYGPLKNMFFSHYHFDHYAGLSDLLSRAYQTRTYSKLDTLDLYGPVGLAEIIEGTMAGLEVGAELHNWNPSRPNLPVTPTVHEVDLPETGITVVYEDENVIVSATRADHDEDVPNAYAYRFDIISGDSAGKSVVFSGDTKKDDQVIALAQDATILVHEVQMGSMVSEISAEGTALYEHLVNSHTDVTEIPEIALEANVELVVLSHYSAIDDSYSIKEAASMMLEAVLDANESVGYKGKIFAPSGVEVIGLDFRHKLVHR